MANNRPNMRPNMGPGAPGWIGAMGIPAQGFGVVPQQPGGGMIPAQPHTAPAAMMPQPGIPQATTLNTWQQQYMAQQPQQQQQQQQQWFAVNQKVAEEQKKQHEQYLKQRQFNEQKQRLMSASGGRNKSEVSADSMINNILGGNGGPRPKVPHTQKQGPSHSSDNTTLPQGSKAADWGSMAQMGDLFSHQKGGYSKSESCQPESGVHPPSSIPSDSSSQPSNHGQTMGVGPGYDINKTVMRSGTEESAAAASASAVLISSNTGSSGGLALPNWLTGGSLPPVYTATLALVEGVEPGWVDTGRAYMLLMKTGLPPPFLAVLWEMANRTKPGQLKNEEFTVLLALVAAVQGGHTVNNLEALMSCNEPVLPIIDHPALLPLVQDYILKRQQAQQQALHQQALEQDLVQEAAAAVLPAPAVNMPLSTAAVQPTLPGMVHQQVPVPGIQTPIPGIHASAVSTLQQNTVPIVGTQTAADVPPFAGGNGCKPENEDDEFTDFMSPHNNIQNIAVTTTAATVDDYDDDFADFQSAAAAAAPPAACQPPKPSTPTTAPTAGLIMPPPPPPTSNISSTNLSPLPLPKSMTNLDTPCMSSPSTTASTGALSSSSNTMPSVTPPQTNTNNSTSLLQQPDSFVDNGDRYAAFRDLEEVNPPPSLDVDTISELPSLGPGSSVDDDQDESFGDFCSSEATNSLPTSAFSSMAFTNSQMVSNDGSLNQNLDRISNPLSYVPNSVTADSFEATFEADFGVFSSSTSQAAAAPSDNYADLHEAMKKSEEQKLGLQARWDDPFGEFEEATSSLAVPDIISNSPDDGDDDFGDFVGPGSSDSPPDTASLSAFPRLPEGLAETQSVASLELPGLEVTVGLQLSEGRGSGAGPSPDLLEQSRGDINLGLEDKLQDLSLESSTVASVFGSVADVPLTTITSGCINPSSASSLPVVDRYSIIRQEDNKESLSEAHTGSWEKCLEGAVRLLEEANTILDSITDQNIKKDVLETTQMVAYIQNLHEVWCVVQRIKSSSQRVPTSTQVDTLMQQADTLWENIGKNAKQLANEVSSAAENENIMSPMEVCGVCLSGGGSKLMYGGAAYHPPCANLWINCIDLVLPSLTPVTLL